MHGPLSIFNSVRSTRSKDQLNLGLKIFLIMFNSLNKWKIHVYSVNYSQYCRLLSSSQIKKIQQRKGPIDEPWQQEEFAFVWHVRAVRKCAKRSSQCAKAQSAAHSPCQGKEHVHWAVQTICNESIPCEIYINPSRVYRIWDCLTWK